MDANREAQAYEKFTGKKLPSAAVIDIGSGTAIDGNALLQDVESFVKRFVSYPSEHEAVAHALWIAHTFLMECWHSTPRLAFISPEKGSGKTRALEVTETLTRNPVLQVNCSSAYLFRKVSESEVLPVILYDEIDTLFNGKAQNSEEVRGFINAGHRKGAKAGRCVIRGKSVETEELAAYCAVAIAGLGNLPDTIFSRSVVVRMRKRAPNERVESFRQREHSDQGNAIRDRLELWALQVEARAKQIPVMPEGVEDRDADTWEALLAVADAVGGDWPAKARKAAVALVTAAKQSTPSLGVRLLADLKKIFGDRDAIPTVEILAELVKIEEAPWQDMKGKPIDDRRLANLLKPYGVASKVIRVGNATHRGYERTALHDPWIRYLPPVSPESVTSETSETSTGVTAVTDVMSIGGTRADRRLAAERF